MANRVIEILREHIQQLQDDDGNLRAEAHVHFDEFFPGQGFEDRTLDFCLEVFNDVLDNYAHLKPNNRVYFRLALPLKGVSDTLVMQPPDINDLTDCLCDREPPSIEVIPFERASISPWVFETYIKQLTDIDFKSSRTMFAYYACARCNERWDEYGSRIRIECDPEPIEPWSVRGMGTMTEDN